MIALLCGEIAEIGLNSAIIQVQGVGYEFFATPNFLSQLQLGQTTTIHTYQVVREDALTLYGFADSEGRKVFSILIGVSGIGPKLALAALAVFPPAQLRQVVSNRDEKLLSTIPGVGKKSAQRMLMELGDKLGAVASEGTASLPSAGIKEKEVIQALEQLGWKSSLAAQAVAEAKDNAPEAGVAQLLRSALQILGRIHG